MNSINRKKDKQVNKKIDKGIKNEETKKKTKWWVTRLRVNNKEKARSYSWPITSGLSKLTALSRYVTST